MFFATKIFEKERQNFPLWLPVFFGSGVAFYLTFKVVFLPLLCFALLLFLFNRSLIVAACALFLLGGFYAELYDKPDQVQAKIFADVTGKVESAKPFTNPVNGVEGLSLVVSDVSLKKVETVTKKKTETKKQKKKKKKISQKKIEKDFVNLAGYQEIDRKFLDYSNAYQDEIPPELDKISVNTTRSVSVNDRVAFRALLQPPAQKDFPSEFDYALYAKTNKIAASGFVSGDVAILEKGKISNLDDWFLSLREKIRAQILSVLNGDEAAVAVAFLIGDQKQISKDLSEKIRHSGLSHLLSISGFHLSLAGAIFFFSLRYLLARSEYLALHFDLKKIASLAAIFATYFYLKIAGSPLPAQRSFIFVCFALLALFFSEKLDVKRATMFGALLLILLNPYVIFSVSFQLSFAAILVLTTFAKPGRNYFLQIIFLSIFIQIATAPILMHHFQSLSLLGLTANLVAIPLVTFVVMPLGFLALFLMPLTFAKPVLLLMNLGILALEKIAYFTTSLPYSYLTSPWLPSSGLALAIFGLLLLCLARTQLRFLGITIFCASFLTIFLVKKPDVIFEQHQKFFAVFDESGLSFSKKLKPSKQRQSWMKQFNESEFKTLPCERNFCIVEVKNKKILVLLKRNKISDICESDADVIVNLTKKYQLPDCISADKIKLDNKDFYPSRTRFLFITPSVIPNEVRDLLVHKNSEIPHFVRDDRRRVRDDRMLLLKDKKFRSQKVHRRSEKKRDDESDIRNDAEGINGDFEDEGSEN